MIQPLPTSTLFPYTTLFRSILHYNTPDGQYTGLFNSLKAGLKKYNITAKADQSFFLDLSRAQEIARTVITKLKDAGVTTVIYTGDPVMPGSFTKEATAQDWHPEWVVGPKIGRAHV